MEGYDDALRLGYKFATHRRLKGHGYEAEYEKTRALRILDLGGVRNFLLENREFSPELYKLLYDDAAPD